MKTKRIVSLILTFAMLLSASFLTAGAAKKVTKAKAKSIVLANAKVKASKAVFSVCKKTKDDGVAIYELEFFTSKEYYEYDVKTSSGKIVDKEVKKLKNPGKFISRKKAKSISVKQAGFKKSSVKFTKCEYDFEKGLLILEVEFVKGNKEYEYDINARTGAVIKSDVDRVG